MTTTSAPGEEIILSGLRKSYGHLRAVNSIDLTIKRGETVALLGPNGAGKTTTLDMMMGLTRPDSGSVSLFGMPPSRAAKAGLIGGMLQTGSPIDHLRVCELFTMVSSLYPRPLKVNDVLRLTGTQSYARRPTNRLSGGQTQRVRFGVALISNADLLVLDEPTAAIDVEGRREFWAAMREVAEAGKTVIFATHYLEEADAYAGRIVLIARGKIVADGPATEIKAKAGGRTIRATLPAVDVAQLAGLPGVTNVQRHGDAVALSTSNSDETVRALLGRFPETRDIEVQGAGLEEAFLALTAGENDGANHSQGVR